jgi:hypothetical protein
MYAFNAKGGSMTNSLSYYAADGGYYVGQTPKQTRPLRTTIRNVTAWGNVSGYTGTNSRYVTISRSKFFNNGIGVVPNSLDSEKFPPQEQNVFRDNDVYWNNFDVYRAAPYKAKRGSNFAYPPGLGFIVLSGRDNVIEGNRVYGNWLAGYVGVQNPFLKNPADQPLGTIRVMNNAFGLNGTTRTAATSCSRAAATTTASWATRASRRPCRPIRRCSPRARSAARTPRTARRSPTWPTGPCRATTGPGWREQPHAARADGVQPLVDYRTGVKYGPTGL